MTQAAVAGSATPTKVLRSVPVGIDSLFTKAEFVLLTQHMVNGNPASQFLVAWCDKDGKAQYAKAAPHKNAETHAGWTYDTIAGKAKAKTSMAVYPKNNGNQSTFGGLDFDAHEP